MGIAAVSLTAVSVAGVGVDTRKMSRLSKSKSDRKIGHWRLSNDGQVTYKKVCQFSLNLNVLFSEFFLYMNSVLSTSDDECNFTVCVPVAWNGLPCDLWPTDVFQQMHC